MLNQLFYPEDYGHYYSPYEAKRRNEMMRRREWEARRRRQLELECHRRQQKEEEARRRRCEAMRQRQLQKDEEERRRRVIEATRRREQEEEALRQRLYGISAGRRPAMEYPAGTLLRGRDGQLYRILRDDVPEMVTSDTDMSIGQSLPVRKTVRVNSPSKSRHTTEHDDIDESVLETPAWSKTNPTKAHRKRVTIVVEDASDSENEDDSRDSTWHNRRPSPGQWIEPVECI